MYKFYVKKTYAISLYCSEKDWHEVIKKNIKPLMGTTAETLMSSMLATMQATLQPKKHQIHDTANISNNQKITQYF